MDEYTNYLIEALENAETDEERHDLIKKCLRHRPDVKAFMAAMILSDAEQQQAAFELLKPHDGKIS